MKSRSLSVFLVFLLVFSLVGLAAPARPVEAAVTGTLAIQGGTGEDTVGTAITWSRQGGKVRVRVTDADLNVAVRRVIMTTVTSDAVALDDTAGAGGAAVTVTNAANSATLTLSAAAPDLAVDDTILVSTDETVRKVTAVAGTAVTVNLPLVNAHTNASAWEVVHADAKFDKCPACAKALEQTTITALGNNVSTTINIADLFTLADTNLGADFTKRFSGAADSVINKQDVDVRQGDGTVLPTGVTFSVALDNGTLTITNGSGANVTITTPQVVLWASAVNVTGSTVKLTSNADAAGITISLTETGANTGVFATNAGGGADVELVEGPSDAAARQLKVGKADVVTVSYSDAAGAAGTATTVSQTINVETTGASFANLTPAHNDATNSSLPIVAGDVTDSGSGVVKSTIRVVFKSGTTVVKADPNDGVTGSVAAITGGFRATQRNTIPNIVDADIEWWIVGKDLAGNPAVSDRNADTACAAAGFTLYSFTTDTVDAGGSAGNCDSFKVKVDNTAPAVAFTGTPRTITGQWWDATVAVTEANEGTENDERLQKGSKAKQTSVRVVFSEAIDGATVQASDFTVGGVTALNAEWFSGAASSVFLTVPTLARDATPEVKLVGEVKDKAGNALATGTGNAGDGIPAKVTVTVTGKAASLPVTEAKIKVRVETDENLVTTPTLTVKRRTAKTTQSATDVSSALLSVGARVWEREFTVAGDAGQYNVVVTSQDLGGGLTTTVGKTNPSDAKAVLFEFDKGVPDPVVTNIPADSPNPFISINFVDEGREYGLDANDAVTIVPGEVVTNLDTHAKVTLTKATLDGTSVLAQFSTLDSKKYSMAATGLSVGDHTLVIDYNDEAGNKAAAKTFTLKVTAKQAITINVKPGWNLVSVPAPLDDPSVSSVFAGVTAIERVYGFDATVGWQLSTFDAATGKWSGSLAEIRDGKGYWVFSTSFAEIKVFPAERQPTTPLPQYSLTTGWNLVGFTSLAAGVTSSDVDGYLASLGTGAAKRWTTLVSFDPEVGYQTAKSNAACSASFDSTAADTLGECAVGGPMAQVKQGRGYWIYLTADAVLAP